MRFFTQRLNLDKRYRNAVNKKYFEPGRASVRALEDEIRNFTDYINSEGPFNGKGYVAATRLSETSIDLVLATVDCTEKDAECLFDVMKNGLENIVIPESKYSSSKFNEITNGSFDNYMNAAEHHNLVDDSDEYSMYLGDYAISSQRGFRHGEVIIDMKTKAQIYSDAKKSIAPANLTNELDNIYSYPSNENVKGHPIHYIIRTDDLERRKFIYKPLLSALYNNKRIVSRRYLFFDAGENTINYDNLYKNLTDCTVVIRFNSDTLESGDEICSFNQEIYEICESIKKYRNQVLTVLVLPIKADGIMEILADNLQDMSFVSIEEENLSHKEALKVLRTLAKEYSTTIDNSIKTRLDKDKTYSVDELNNIFNEWYNNHIKESYFPCYSDSMTFNKEMFKKEVKGKAIDELNEMIGLDNAKKAINRMVSFNKMNKLFKQKGLSKDSPTMNCLFTGNPGVGKTQAARLFAKIMAENKILSKGHLVECTRKDLVAKYVGHTAKNVEKYFNMARNGILFIDEAYSLCDDRDGSFGDEAISTIVELMENRRNDTVVILAGYKDKMAKFLDKNPGLRSRLAFHVDFDDYDTKSLIDITHLMAKKSNLTLSEGIDEKLSSIYDKIREDKEFGNARYCRNLLENARMSLAERLVNKEYEDITVEELCTITPEDIKASADIILKSKDNHIGFAV